VGREAAVYRKQRGTKYEHGEGDESLLCASKNERKRTGHRSCLSHSKFTRLINTGLLLIWSIYGAAICVVGSWGRPWKLKGHSFVQQGWKDLNSDPAHIVFPLFGRQLRGTFLLTSQVEAKRAKDARTPRSTEIPFNSFREAKADIGSRVMAPNARIHTH
jgi:hypothetical protein